MRFILTIMLFFRNRLSQYNTLHQPSYLPFTLFQPAVAPRYPVLAFVSNHISLFSQSFLIAKGLRFATYNASIRVRASRLLFNAELFLCRTLMCFGPHSAILHATAPLPFVACHESALDPVPDSQ